MSDLEKLVRRRIEEEHAKGSSTEEIAKVVRDIFNSVDVSGKLSETVGKSATDL